MKCICVGGGDFASEKFKSEKADVVIAADSGYEYIKNLIKVDYVIGDLDSLGYTPKVENLIKLNCHKDNTDMFEATSLGLEKGADEFVIYGALGKRLDHTIANLQNAKYLVEKGAKVTLVDLKQTLYFVKDELCLHNMVDKTVSVFSFDKANLSLEGFYYPLNNHTLTNSYPLGVSNVVVEKDAYVRVNSGIVIVIVNDAI